MRVLVCGPPGVCKKEAIKSVTSLANQALTGLARNAIGRPWIKNYSIEDEIKSLTGGDLQPFLDNHDAGHQRLLWEEACDKVHKKLEKENPCHAFISVHLVMHRSGYLFSCVDWDRLARLRPSVVVTLIDDVYDCEERLKTKGSHTFPKGQFPTWPELLVWRSAEISAAQDLCHNLFLNPEFYQIPDLDVLPDRIRHLVRPPLTHLLCPVKHPPETLFRLLFQRQTLPVYASFPITRPRRNEESRNEVDMFRRDLHSQFATIDPLAMDERRVWFEAAEGLDVMIRPTQRWPMGMSSMVSPCENLDEQKIAEKVADNLEIIDQHIKYRDYGLVRTIRQCRGSLVAYRPYWGGGKIAGGVDKELTYGSSMDVKLFMVDDPAIDGRDPAGPLDIERIVTAKKTLQDLLRIDILPLEEKRKEILEQEQEQETWEQ